jgi:type I site-specific restriction endonuclease
MDIFDPVRKKWVAPTPEENVRQQLIHYLHTQKAVPLSLIGVEKSLKVNNLPKRYDVVVFSNEGKPLLLAECKAPRIVLDNAVFEQAARYNLALHAPYLLITNGAQTYCCRVDFATQGVTFLAEVPSYGTITNCQSADLRRV